MVSEDMERQAMIKGWSGKWRRARCSAAVRVPVGKHPDDKVAVLGSGKGGDVD